MIRSLQTKTRSWSTKHRISQQTKNQKKLRHHLPLENKVAEEAEVRERESSEEILRLAMIHNKKNNHSVSESLCLIVLVSNSECVLYIYIYNSFRGVGHVWLIEFSIVLTEMESCDAWETYRQPNTKILELFLSPFNYFFFQLFSFLVNLWLSESDARLCLK